MNKFYAVVVLTLMLNPTVLMSNPVRFEEPTIQDIITSKYPYLLAVYGSTNVESPTLHELYSDDKYMRLRDLIRHTEPKKETHDYFKAAMLAAGITGGIGVAIAFGMMYWMNK